LIGGETAIEKQQLMLFVVLTDSFLSSIASGELQIRNRIFANRERIL